MRFQLTCSRGDRLYQLRLGETPIPVRHPPISKHVSDVSRITWTWLDGVEYTVLRPRWPDGLLRVMTGETMVCSGFAGVGKRVLSLWEFAGQAIECRGGAYCCKIFPRTFTIRHQDGIRLAFFAPHNRKLVGIGCTYEGILRKGLPESLVPVVFAIILTGVHLSMWCAGGD